MMPIIEHGEYPLSEEDMEFGYQPFDISGYSEYHPIQSILGEELDFIQKVRSVTSVYDFEEGAVSQVPLMHVKFSPLLDPIRYVTGKYDLHNPEIRNIATQEYPKPAFAKLGSPHNAAYVDSLFCYLSSQLVRKHGFVNGIKCYGIASGVQAKYKMNIGNDLDFIEDSPYFRANLGTNAESDAWCLVPSSSMDVLGIGPVAKKVAPRIHIDEEVLLDGVEELDVSNDTEVEPSAIITQQEPTMDIQEASHFDVLDSDIIELKSNSSHKSDVSSRISISSTEASDDSEDWSTEDDNDEDDEQPESEEEDSSYNVLEEEDELYMYVRNFPVQMIFMEKFEGTLDQLILRNEIIDELEISSALIQVIMTLLVYKRAYNFTHNDLHTSNIMYKTTTEQYLYYIYDGKTYRVPTYGRIFTLIDFGRAIYEYKGQRFCSDSFAPEGDAYTQYNTEPFYNPKKPRIDPNPSFDLCRLGCSLYDLALDGLYDTSEMDPYQQTVFRWCQDDYGRNILYKQNGDERYPNFKSYKMIARTAHAHTPELQLEQPFFSRWLSTYLGDGPVMNIDAVEPESNTASV